jgi:hypothetical protein
MGAARKRTVPNRKHRTRAVASEADPSPRVERLRRDFAKFRREHPLRTRIPDSLRNAALAARRSGSSESEIRRACGVTSDQIAQWRKPQQKCAQARELEGQAPRVFPVVDDLASMGMTQAGESVQQELELRIGGWAICVRQVEG